jgi:hypothetical protein
MFKVIKTPEQIAAEQAKQQRELRITELKRLLADSDFRVLPDYDKDSEEIKAQRQAWREEIRALEAQS